MDYSIGSCHQIYVLELFTDSDPVFELLGELRSRGVQFRAMQSLHSSSAKKDVLFMRFEISTCFLEDVSMTMFFLRFLTEQVTLYKMFSGLSSMLMGSKL